MLVLTRRVDEQVVIGNNVTITVLEVRGSRIRLGIAAPREMGIRRKEPLAAIRSLKNPLVSATK